ncbi:MAG TPA: flagellar hook-basal body complex protein, partial [Acetobacteraceae bacterium]|nr:flagellar hook-basal body complex protein [Acetobacteraceae bacterium]
AVVAQPDYVNGVQGAITQTDIPLNLAVAGQGFFAVSQQTGQIAGQPTFNPQQFYTRAGDFALNSQGYLVNSSGQFLNGWMPDPVTGVINQNALAPIQVLQTALNPVATANVNLSANLPATPTAGTATATSPISSNITVYDALGTAHTVSLGWSLNAANDWTVTITVPDAATPDVGTADVQFGPQTSGNAVNPGTVGQIGSTTGTVTSAGFTTGGTATMALVMDFGSGAQTVNLNLGTYGGAAGLTQYAGTTYDLQGISQDGVPPGSFSGVTTQANGDVVVNYNNGQTRTIAQVPLITFNAPNSLQGQDGQSFTSTIASGNPLADAVNTNGAGSLVVSSVEGSNVDIATEFSQLIIAQQAYAANAKVVTTANNLLESTINMKQ